MKLQHLFQSLVTGGALMASGSVISNPEATPNRVNLDDAPVLVFCERDNPDMCVVDEGGARHVREGLVCCWGTSCD